MRFDQPLQPATLLLRYKRFLADVRLHVTGEETTVHVANPGAMLGLQVPGSSVWLSRSASLTRKLPLSLEIVEADGGFVGVNTHLPNGLVAEALAAGAIPELAGYASVRREVKYGEASRIDFLLEDPALDRAWLEVKNSLRADNRSTRLWLEVKSVTLSRSQGLAEWPDCRSVRSAKHLRELTSMAQAGDRAVILFVVQRGDCEEFSIAADLDPAFASGLKIAKASGVEVLIYGCDVGVDGISITRRLRWAGYDQVGGGLCAGAPSWSGPDLRLGDQLA